MTNDNKKQFFQASFILPDGISHYGTERYSSVMEEVSHSVTVQLKDDDNRWYLQMMFYDIEPPTPQDVIANFSHFPELSLVEQDVSIELIPDTNWLEHVYREFPPITIGDFFVYGEHYKDEIPSDLTPLQISTAMAFGSGEHHTTQGCLLVMQKLKNEGLEFSNILDMGCGSGILAVAAAKLWSNAKITAIDIEEESQLATVNHAKINNCLSNITAETGDGYNTELSKTNAPYDLIIANILSSVLIEMAPDLAKNLKNNGYAILAGLLIRQIEYVSKAHDEYGIKLINQYLQENWGILTLKRS